MKPRTVPLVSRTPLTRTGEPGRSSSLERGGPIRAVSAKRAAENRVRAKVIAVLFPVYEPPPLCDCGCGRLADDVHEILSRARGGSITDPPNMAVVARPCHTAITDEAFPDAYPKGLSRHSWDGPPPPALAGPLDGLRGPVYRGVGQAAETPAPHAARR
jgi:hypothetical protein